MINLKKQNIKFCAGITLYYPEEKCLTKINKYAEVFDKIFVYDNTDDGKINNYLFPQNVDYYTNGNNDGLPHAYNYMLHKSQANNMDYLCLLDQDSDFSNVEINKLLSFIRYNKTIVSSNIAIYAPFIIFDRECYLGNNDFDEQEWVITAGSFINVKLFKENDLEYDENYFIDRVDADMCKRIRDLGLKIIVYNNSKLFQSLGEKTKFTHPNHTPIRHYYIFRDRLYFFKKYYSYCKFILLATIKSINHIRLVILFENKKMQKMKYMVRALADFRKGIKGSIKY